MPYKSIKRNVPTNAVSWKEISALPNSHWIRKLTLNERQISGVNSHSGCWWFGRQSDTSCAALALTIFWLRLGAVHEMDLYMTSNSLTRSYRMTEWGVFFPVPLFVNNKSGIFWTALSYIASYMLLLHSIHYIYIYTMPIYFFKKKKNFPIKLKSALSSSLQQWCGNNKANVKVSTWTYCTMRNFWILPVFISPFFDIPNKEILQHHIRSYT